jgi:8-hydroxy-5-deazaflavin:NADPH oxidoreductase
MRIGVLGTGMVGRAISTRLVELGHEVVMGTRDRAKADDWVSSVGTAEGARSGSFAEAAAHGELVVNATSGLGSLDALRQAGAEHLRGKVLVDIANPLDFSHGMPPRLSVVNTDSLGEQIQREFPQTQVVKTLNTVNADVMVAPQRLTEAHTIFVAGNSAEAKATVTDLLRSFGWSSILDLGGIAAARGMEMYLPLWLSLMGAQGTAVFNIKVVRAQP